MRAVDTNLVVRLTVRDTPKQVVAAENEIASGAWVSMVVLTESLWVLSSIYAFSRAQQQSFLKHMLAHDYFNLQEPDVVQSAAALFVEHPKVGFADCLLLEAARKSGHLPLVTFDAALSKLPGAVRLRV